MFRISGKSSPEPKFKKLISNAAVLLTGGLGTSLLGVVSIILIARHLGPDVFGVFALITSTALVVDRLVNFQSWQAVVKYGSQLGGGADRDASSLALAKLVAGCFFFDFFTALVGAVLASATLYFLGGWMGWGTGVQYAGAAFGLVVGSKISGTAIGVFRLFEDYWAQVKIQLFASVLRVALAAIGVTLGWGIKGFLISWAATEALMHIVLTVLAFHRFRAREGVSVFAVRPQLDRHVKRFMIWTNVAVAADLPAKELDVVLVGILAGEREAGIYKIARQGMALVGKLSSPLYQAIYPVQSRFLASGDRAEAVRITIKGSAWLLAASSLLIILAWPLLPFAVPFVLGDAYGGAWAFLLFAMVVKSVDNIFTPVHSLFIALGYVRSNLVILMVANGAMLSCFWVFVPRFGVYAALSCIGLQAVIVLLMKIAVIVERGKRYRG